MKSIRSEDALVKEWSSGIPFKVTKRKGKARDKDRIIECPVKQTVGTRFNELLILKTPTTTRLGLHPSSTPKD